MYSIEEYMAFSFLNLRVVARTICSGVMAVCSFSTVAAADETYLDFLKQRAREVSLAQSKPWQVLLHYAPHRLDFKSKGEVDGVEGGVFYLAAEGKQDPLAELDATLESFARTDVHGDDHPQCRYVARYRYLKEVLKFDESKLHEESCPRFNEWFHSLNPGRITVIFPAAYLNNPSSMFGHTLMRIDPAEQSEAERLTSYGVNFGANTGESQGILFAVKGIFGGYSGGFSVAPYYVKVVEYSDIENRDIWEYELNLSQDEIYRLVYHLWELRGANFDYYFFDENCSYHLLSLIENARPETELRRKVSSWVIPVDTIREILKLEGILKRAVFRPSSKKVLDYRLSLLSSEEKLIAKALGEHRAGAIEKLQELSDSNRPTVLDAAIDYLSYRTYKNSDLLEQEGEYQFELLNERSRLPVEASPPSTPAPPRPDLGHLTNRFSLGAGTENRKAYYDLSIRPAYHDLLDPESGYAPGAQIQFLGLNFRQQEEQGFKLERFDLLDILSLSPWDEIFQGFSWRVSTGAKRERFGENQRYLSGNFDLGAGLTFKPSTGTTLFAMIGPQVFYSEQLSERYSLGVGPTVGLYTDLCDKLRILFDLRGGEYFGESSFRNFKGSIQAAYTVEKNLAIRSAIERGLNFGESEYENWSTTLNISVMRYF